MHKKTEERMAAKLAKMVALICVRNTYLEDLHAGKIPVSKTGDYSDVKVIDGEGHEIPWNELSRLDDVEMKKLMKEVVNKLYTFYLKAEDPKFQAALEYWRSAAEQWDDPELDSF
jgi:hypothetical protein